MSKFDLILNKINFNKEEKEFYKDIASYIDYDLEELSNYTSTRAKEYDLNIFDLSNIPSHFDKILYDNNSSIFDNNLKAEDIFKAVNNKFFEINDAVISIYKNNDENTISNKSKIRRR